MTYPVSTQKIIDHPAALAGMMRRVAIAAGDLIMDYFDESGFSGDINFKQDKSPVTEADIKADEFIRNELSRLMPGIPMITEETVTDRDHDMLSSARHYWLVDGLDGTKHFKNGEKDFTVNIALIDRDIPVLGVVYAPAHGEGYVGWAKDTEKSAYKWYDDSDQDVSICVRSMPMDGATFLTSTTHREHPALTHLMNTVKIKKHIKRSSSIKYCDVAAGRADIVAIPRDNISFWDSAAADAVLRGSGGCMISLSGNLLRYDRNDPDLCNHGLIACGDIEFIQLLLPDLIAVCG